MLSESQAARLVGVSLDDDKLIWIVLVLVLLFFLSLSGYHCF